MRLSRRNVWLIALAAGLIAPRASSGGTEIFAITPETGPAGTEVRIKGRGLEGTKHVLFAVGATAKTAKFRVISDDELEVVAPEYFRPGAAATVAVLGPAGLAVAMPASVQTIRRGSHWKNPKEPGAGFYHILEGGRVPSADSVSLVEHGGVLSASQEPAMQLVKTGGVLTEFYNPNGIVFYERGAILGPGMFNPRETPAQRLFHVTKITASPGVGPFVYQGVPRPDAARILAVPPRIEDVSPPAAGAGEIVTLKGRGFTRTTEVLFLHNDGQSRPAGFRIVSDWQLKVEVPDKHAITGAQLIMVVTTEGLTLTLPRRVMLRPSQTLPAWAGRGIPKGALVWLGDGDFLANSDRSSLVFVAAGGQLALGEPGTMFFVQRDGALFADRNGAAVSDVSSGGLGGVAQMLAKQGRGRVYYEPGAILPEELKKAPLGRATPAIVPSYFDGEFVILPGPLFRR